MLIEGFPFNSAVETLPEFTANAVWRVSSDALAHRLSVCIDRKADGRQVKVVGGEATSPYASNSLRGTPD